MRQIMNTKTALLKWSLPAVTLSAAAVSCLLFTAAKTRARYVAHEWGTFTSVQGADGALLDWRPLETSRLPQFVYNWSRPGLSRQPQAFRNKSAMLTLQRMETPVIYFYSEQAQTVDVSVHFPRGLITEWYPQADRIGPSSVPVPQAIAALDNCAHHVGVKPGFTFASLLPNAGTPDSEANWAHVEITPAAKEQYLRASLPQDDSGSHYFSARETEANLLSVPSRETTNPAPQFEKFIFYRGVGSFSTPLRVTMESNDAITLANEGAEPLAHLFVLRVADHKAAYIYTPGLHRRETRQLRLNLVEVQEPLSTTSSRLGARMAQCLQAEGLYTREAQAMVLTWKDSWFEEDGLRVLYVLPRSWADQTLPLALNPSPRELKRVMVGRAEVLTPGLEQKLSEHVKRVEHGGTKAREQFETELRKLGRFAEPALRLALQGTSAEESQQAWALYQTAVRAAEPRTF
jgi:hypothetical protein